MEKKVLSIIRLAIAPKIKYNVLKEATSKALWTKLESIYASKLLTNRLCLKIELYSLKMEEGCNLHDHINAFNQLVCQLLNADDNIEDGEQALLLIASLPKSYKPIVQTMLVRKTMQKLNEVTTVLWESERMLRNEYSQRGDQVIAMACSKRGRSQSKRRGGPREKSQYRSKDMSSGECYYCGEKCHIQNCCPKLKEDLASLRKLQEKMRGKAKLEDEEDSDANVIDEGDVFLAESAQERVHDSIEGQNS